LRSGDTIPGEVTKIDDKGISFDSPIAETDFIPHEAVKAVELGGSRSLLELKKAQRHQLLTLPRLLRNAPPSHLVCSHNADFLRGRIVEMDDNKLTLEVRLTAKVIPRDRVAHLIWFHDDELSGEAPPSASQRTGSTRVQTVRANGNRLTFVAEKLVGELLLGKSNILGQCRVALADVDQLLIGESIEHAAADLVFHQWRLQHAKDPLFTQETANANGPAGIESPLVGHAAPDFTLKQLNGQSFQLSKRTGKVVVLDFWATWCGPCLQTMPLVDRVVEEFSQQGVELVAVNLEEQAAQVSSMLERHKFDLTVALDRDGVVASKYAVTAIPQTVVIDRNGIVSRLFVGGGKRLEDPLREAIQEAVDGKSSDSASTGETGG
jgi:thiol-disulfide isomerase/thioredoxin